MARAKPAAVLLHSLRLLLLLQTAPLCLSTQRRHPARVFGRLPENSPAGTPVDGVALPVGAGGCHGADLTASLKGDYASDFKLVRKRAQNQKLGLVSTRTLDREFIAMYRLIVELPPRCRRRPAAVQVEVLDRNDNTPRFTGGNQTVEVDELTPLGTELARFDAKDSDAGTNGRVTVYASPPSELLHVVPQTGQVRLVGSLLGVRVLLLRLYARDGGDAALTGGPVFLRVTVRRFRRAPRRSRDLSEELTYTVNVPDQARVGDLVFTVPDRRFEQRHFEVMPEADSPVQIERDSGRMYLMRSLHAPVDVLVRIHNLRGKKDACVRVCVRVLGMKRVESGRFLTVTLLESSQHTHARALQRPQRKQT